MRVGPPPTPTLRASEPLTFESVREIDLHGHLQEYRVNRGILINKFGLLPRDIRTLRTSAFGLNARKGYILFDLGELKGYIQFNRVVLFDVDRRATARLESTILHNLRRGEEAFEVVVLESVLEELQRQLEGSFNRLDALVQPVLRDLSSPSRGNSFEAGLSFLLPLENALGALQLRCNRIFSIVDELLDTEEDLDLMSLTAWQARATEDALTAELDGEQLLEDGRPPVGHDHQELLLETCSANLEQLTDRIENLVGSIDNTRSVLELVLDNERNRIARLELYLSIASLGLGLAAAVGGFFGMNLVSGLEEKKGMFWGVTIGTLVVCKVLCIYLFRMYHRFNRFQRQQVESVQQLKRMLAQPTDDGNWGNMGFYRVGV